MRIVRLLHVVAISMPHQRRLTVIRNNPLAELNQCIFNSPNRVVIHFVYILKDCKCTNFPDNSGKQPFSFFSIISNNLISAGESLA